MQDDKPDKSTKRAASLIEAKRHSVHVGSIDINDKILNEQLDQEFTGSNHLTFVDEKDSLINKSLKKNASAEGLIKVHD